jgi:hypothetical protein
MTTPSFDPFGAVRVVAGPDRTRAVAAMERHGLADDPRAALVDPLAFDDAGTFASPAARALYLAHLAVLDEAAAGGHGVLILHDHADPAHAARAPATAARDWHILDGGSAYIAFSATAAPRVAAFLRAALEAPAAPAIDEAYARFRAAHPDLHAVSTRPLRAAAHRVAGRVSFGMREAACLAVGSIVFAWIAVHAAG